MNTRVAAVLASGVLVAGAAVTGWWGGPLVAPGAGVSSGSDVVAAGSDATGGRYVSTMRLADGRSVGSVRFLRDPAGTRVIVSLRTPADLAAAGSTFHGFHVHANSDPANGSGCVADPGAAPSTWFVSADGHWTDPGAVHGEHTGDLPVVYLQENGRATATFVTDRFEPEDVVGRAVIVHAAPDNYGNVPLGDAPTDYTENSAAALDLTDRTGNAGDRIACGVVSR